MAMRLIQINTVLAPKVVAGLGDGGAALLMVEIVLAGKPIGDFTILEIETLAKAELQRLAASV